MIGKIRNRLLFGLARHRHGLVIMTLTMMALCMTVLCHVPVFAAQDTEFRLDMDSLHLTKGVSTTVVVSMVNAPDARLVTIDGLEDFDILSQSQSQSTSISNGAAESQTDLYYTIMPKAAGQFTLKANITYNGQSNETNSLQVTVTEAADSGEDAVSDLFVKTIISHEEAYLGEKVVVSYDLYVRDNIEDYGFTDYLAIDGMVIKEIPDDQLKTEPVYIDGNKYTKYEAKQLILDPITAGVYTVPSFELQVNVVDNSSVGLMDPFGILDASTPKYLQTEEKELLVKELPSAGKPSDFSGIVGELKLDGNYSREEMDYGDSFTLQVEASGNCNLDGLKSVIGTGVAGITVYENQKNTEESVESNQYHVKKEMEAILIPEKTGTLEVPSISLSYFNPVTESYETAEIPGVTVEVHGDMAAQNGNDSGQAGNTEMVLINQVNYADTGTDNGYFSVQIKKKWIYAAAAGLAILLLLAIGLVYLASNRKKRNPALKAFYKQLKKSDDINEIYHLFNEMMKLCYQLNVKAGSKDMVKSALPDEALAMQVVDVMDYMESPASRDIKGAAHLKDKIKSIYKKNLCILHKGRKQVK